MCKVVYQRKHEYETIWFDQSVSSTKGINIKENLITMIWSIVMKFNFIRMAWKKLWNAKCFEMSKCKASQCDIRYQRGWIEGTK